MDFQAQAMKQKNKAEKTYARGKNRALYILQRTAKTEHEIRERLKRDDYPDEIINSIIEFLKEYNYINDMEYAKDYLKGKSKIKSHRQIEFELYKKGIKREVTKEVFGETDLDESLTIKRIIEKKKFEWESIGESEVHKLVNYLLRKGFSYEQVLTAVRGYENIP